MIRPLRKQVELLFNTRYGERGARQGWGYLGLPPAALLSEGLTPPSQLLPEQGGAAGAGALQVLLPSPLLSSRHPAWED